MSGQPSRPPVIPPSEYEQNRAAISNYRQYLNMYEKLNEQGLKNHAEIERIEKHLQQQIQAGEEAKRQLELLKQTTGRLRITDGQRADVDVPAMAPSIPPVVVTTPQPSSSSAYIEEVHQEQMPQSTSSYRPYASHPTNSSNTPQPPYTHQPHSVTPQNVPRHSQPMQQNAQTSHLQAQPTTQVASNLGQQSLHPQNYNYYRPHTQQMQHSIPAQSLYHRDYQGYSNHARQTSSSRPNAAAAMPHQSSTQYQQNQSYGGSVSHQQIQENQSHVYGQVKAKAPMVPASQNLGGSSVSRPGQSSGSTTTGAANFEVSSSLNDALGEATAHKTQPPHVPVNLPSRPDIPLSASAGTKPTADATRNSATVSQPPPAHPPAPSQVAPQPSTSSAQAQHPPSTSSTTIPTSNLAPSPMRTPKQADKAHLARDLLRALKRPRHPSSSSVLEPDPKRHASGLKPTISSMRQSELSMQMVQPIASTSNAVVPTQNGSPSVQAVQPIVPIPAVVASTRKSLSSVQMAQPTAATSSTVTSTQNSLPSVQVAQPIFSTYGAVALSPPAPVPVAASSSTEVVAPVLPSSTPIPTAYPPPHVPSHPSDASPNPSSSSLSFLVRSRINQATSFGQRPSNSFKNVGSSATGLGPSQSNQIIALGESTQVPKEKQLDTSAAKISNVTSASAQEGAPITRPGKNEKFQAPPNVNLQGPSTGAALTVQPPPQKDPLFLPSPTTSPVPSSVVLAVAASSPVKKENGGEAASNLTSVKTGPKLFFAHVLVPPLPEWARKWKARQKRSKEVDELNVSDDLEDVSRDRSPSLGDFRGPSTSRSPSASSLGVGDVKFADGGESMTEEPEKEDQLFGNYDEAEQQMLIEHCAILRESFCRWDKCEVALNTPGALLRHMKTVHRPRRITAESPWTCHWAGCGYTVIARDDYSQHIEKHAVLPIWCPFKDCTENFRTPRKCIKHMRSDHDNNAVLRRTATPSAISNQLATSMSKFPKILPPYMTEFVRPASITKQRHETLIISVRRRISGNVPAHLQRYNAARPMPMTPSGKDSEPPNNTPYSFLEHRSTRYSSYLSSPARSKNFVSLNSSHVTNLARGGLVLWPEKDSDEALPEAMMEELEQRHREEENAVEEELLNEEGFDVFGPTIEIKTPSARGENVAGSIAGSSEHARE